MSKRLTCSTFNHGLEIMSALIVRWRHGASFSLSLSVHEAISPGLMPRCGYKLNPTRQNLHLVNCKNTEEIEVVLAFLMTLHGSLKVDSIEVIIS
jgi:hypothetical protein